MLGPGLTGVTRWRWQFDLDGAHLGWRIATFSAAQLSGAGSGLTQ